MALAGADAISAANAVIAVAVITNFRMICLPRVFPLCMLQVVYRLPGCMSLYIFCNYHVIENLCLGNKKFMNVDLGL